MYKVMGGGAWTSAMFKVMEGARSVSHVQGNERGGDEKPQPCTK